MSLSRRVFLQSAGVAAFAQRPSRRPNIVWIMADDLGYADVGCYGQAKIRTPNIDSLARDGMRFTDGYSGCTVCAPSRSVLMTGKHMGHTSVRSNPGGVPLVPEDFTVAEMLKQAGYATGGYGKWGLGDAGTEGAPNRQGFDEFFGYLNQVHAHYFYPEALYRNETKVPLPGNEDGKRVTYSHDAIAERALAFIERNKDKPFFCYMPFTIPHWELLVPEDSLKEYRGKFEEAPFIDKSKHYADQPEMRAAYAAMVTRMDRDIGRVLALLKKLNLENDTIVFFTSDNGAALPIRNENYFNSTGPFRGHKQNFYEGGIRVPFLVRWPGRVKPGSVNPHPVVFYDFLPTAAEIAGVKPPAGIDGISLVPTLTGGKQRAHEYLYWELPRYNGKEGTFFVETPMQALRMGDWKAVRPKPNAPLELYNLKDDIGETRNVAAAQPQVMAKIEGILKTVRVEPRPQKNPPETWRGRS